jgi:ABC-type transport system involved in multi-copper enzyme maturation permease subunit
MTAEYWWLGSAVWSVVAFAGVALLFFERTRRVGVGMLLGFGCLLLIGAGACTVILAVG